MNPGAPIFTRWRVRTGYLIAAAVLILARPTPFSILLGALIGSLGLAIRACAAGYLHKQEQLTVSGPYAYTRNPLYFGSAILALAAAVATRSWPASVLLLGWFTLFYSVVMRREELELRTHHGAAFDAYAQAVPLFFPRIWRSSSSSPTGAFSWARFRKNHEWQASIGFLLFLAVLALLWRLRLPLA